MADDFDEAMRLHRLGRHAEAAVLYEAALDAAPQEPDRRYLLGLCRLEMGQLAEGARHMRALLAMRPRHASGHHALGKALFQLGEADEARDHLEQALALDPALADSALELAALAQSQGDPGRAESILRAALVHHAGYAALWNNLGICCRLQGKADAAREAWRQAIALEPRLAGPWCNLATLEVRASGKTEALAIIRKGLAVLPDDPALHFHHGRLAFFADDFAAAAAALERALVLDPGNRAAMVQLAQVHQQLAEWDALDELMPAVRAEIDSAIRGGACAVSPYFALTLPTGERERTAVAAAEARRREAMLAPRRAGLEFRFARAPRRRIHVGYLSGDWRDNAVAHVACGIFRHHDRDRFEVSALSFGPDDGSTYRQRIRDGAERFVDLRSLEAREAACAIHALGVDILIDVQGFNGNSRPEIFMLRPAPIQVSYLTYLGSMGTVRLDYIIADRTMIAADNRSAFTEAVVTMPHCYQVNDDEAPIGPAATRAGEGLPEDAPGGPAVFCAIHGGHKITRDIFARWMRILARAPDSVLWLSASGRLRENLCAAARRHGIDPDRRFVFARRCPDKADHLARLALADLYLDTPVYGAQSSAVDSLWAGTPVVTRPGDVFSSRGAATLLRTLGLDELIAADYDGYEEIAVRLAGDPAARAALREKVAACVASSPLFDTAGWVRDAERAYAAMRDAHLRGEAPRDIVL